MPQINDELKERWIMTAGHYIDDNGAFFVAMCMLALGFISGGSGIRPK